jgi:NarL family two-component system response regulator LiaR
MTMQILQNTEKACDPLTPREMEILFNVAKGLSNQQIADRLCISYKTVSTHLYKVFWKLDVQNRMQAVLYCIYEGWFYFN